MTPTFEFRRELLRRLLAEPEEEIATNVEYARHTRPGMRLLDFEEIRLELAGESAFLARKATMARKVREQEGF